MTLAEAITAGTGKQAPALLKHLGASGLKGWGDLTKAGLYRLRDELEASCAPGTVKTYTAVFKSILARYEDEGLGFCKDFRAILKARGGKPVKTCLTATELRKLAGVDCRTETERLALRLFLISAYTGMRISDTLNTSAENMDEEGGTLTYTSVKTGVTACIPLSKKVKGWIIEAQKTGAANGKMPLVSRNRILRRLCKRAGICSAVKVHKAGKDLTGQKWEFVSSHTARISFATNLARAGVPLLDLSRMMGHSSTAMTERYIVGDAPRLPAKAMAYFTD